MYAISTVGSLLGTFTASLLLIPLVGTQRTFLAYALSLAIVAVLGLGRRWLPAPLGVGLLLLVPVGTVKAAEEGTVVHEAETTYQYARVIEYPDGRRQLELNEGQAVHSVWRANTVLTGDYWDGFLTLPWTLRDQPPAKIAMLGVAGGTVARAYAKYFPGTVIDAVEIDGELFDIGRRWFGLDNRPQLRLHTEDARPFLRRTRERYDFIFLDTYRQPYIPFYLATREFFELARDRLEPGGAVIINVGHPESSSQLERVLTATMGSAFRHVARDPVEQTNTLLIGSMSAPSGARLRAGAARMPAELRPVAVADARRLGAPLSGGSVYTDDKAPVEWLVDKSILDYAEGDR
jgi:spermidine synthase